jgi:hypothetical protein
MLPPSTFIAEFYFEKRYGCGKWDDYKHHTGFSEMQVLIYEISEESNVPK